MNPRLIDFSDVVALAKIDHLPAYFTMLTIGFILAIFLARRWAQEHDLDPGRMVDFGILMAIWGIIGSRILHVIADGHFWDYVHLCTDPSQVDWLVDKRECLGLKGVWDAAEKVCHPVAAEGVEKVGQCFAWADITAGGFAYYGGFIAAALFSIHYLRKHKWPVARVCDMAGWAIPLGLTWGRMGCFLAGCCFGSHTTSALGVVFPPGSSASRQQWKAGMLDSYHHASLPVHATQIYEALAALIIMLIAYFIVRPRKRFDGQVFIISMIMYAVARFLVEFIRRDDRGDLLGISTSQLVAIGVVSICVYLWFVFKRQSVKIV